MDPNDASTWQAFNALVLTVLGLVISGLLWRARGPASAIRGVAFSLLPIAAFLTGTLKLLWRIGDAFVAWAVRFVFSPLVWLGIIVLALSVALFVVSGVMRRRGIGTRGREPRSARKARPRKSVQGKPKEPSASAAGTEDLDDIESILKKHGIS